MKKRHYIYQLWWQGMENAPDIVKVCHESLLRNYDSETQDIIVLDQYNIFDYITLPDYLMKKFGEGKITITHLSDIIRSMLLMQTGGLWADATMFFTKPIGKELFCKDFFTLKNPVAYPTDITSKWECFFIAGQPDFPLFSLLTDFWLEYWKKEDQLITYLLIDHLFYIAYMENRRVRQAIDMCPSFFYRIDYFQRMLNQKYDSEKYLEIIKNESYIKMSYKFPLKKKIDEISDTYYGHLIAEYLG